MLTAQTKQKPQSWRYGSPPASPDPCAGAYCSPECREDSERRNRVGL